MKKLPLWSAFLLALLCFPALQAQTKSRYGYDNFDSREGVRVESLPTTAVLPAPSKVRPTGKAVSEVKSVSDSVKPSVYVRPRASQIAMTVSKSLDGFTTGNARVDAFIVAAGARNNVDPVLLYSVMHQESSFKPSAISNKGARGLMQLMPATAARFGVQNIFDPQQNIEGGARYIRFLLDMFGGDVGLALAGYNAGEGAVLKYGRRVPPYRETQEYVRRISERYTLMRDPQTARKARAIKPGEVAAVRAEEAVPLTKVEPEVSAVRLPDGRLQLVSQ